MDDTGRENLIPAQQGQPDGAAAPRPRPARVPRTAESVAAGGLFARMIRGFFALSESIDDAERQYGPRLYEAMMNDPAVGSCVDVLRQSACRAIRVTPPEHLQPEPGQESTPEQAKAAEIADFCGRAWRNPRRPAEETLYEFTYGLVEDKLAEVVLARVADGPDRGRLTLDRLKFKPREAWRYVVDAYGNVGFIAGRLPPGEPPPDPNQAINVPGTGGNAILLDLDRFAIFSWANRDSDPRCRPILRRAYNAWNLKQRTWPEKLKGDVQFGTPSIAVIMPEEVGDPAPGEVANLTLPDGRPVETAEDLMLYNALAVANGTAGVFPPGTTIDVIESKREGRGLNDSIDMYDRQIAMAILHAPRTTMEAQHSSKADAESSGDVTEVLIRLVIAHLAGIVRNLFRTLVRLNWGPEAEATMTPDVHLGDVAAQDLPALITALAAWVKAGGAARSQMPAIDAQMNLPPRQPGEDAYLPAPQPQPQPAGAGDEPDGDEPQPQPGKAR